MTLQERIQQDTVAAMKERAQLKLDVLRMVKSGDQEQGDREARAADRA